MTTFFGNRDRGALSRPNDSSQEPKIFCKFLQKVQIFACDRSHHDWKSEIPGKLEVNRKSLEVRGVIALKKDGAI